MSRVGLVESEKSGFGYWYSVWISETEAFLTKNLDNARIMSMNAIVLHKLGIKRKSRKNINGVYEYKFIGYEDALEVKDEN